MLIFDIIWLLGLVAQWFRETPISKFSEMLNRIALVCKQDEIRGTSHHVLERSNIC